MQNPADSLEKAKQLFARHDLRCTKHRASVYAALDACRSHPTAEELHALVNTGPEACCISLATVYNTLDALCAAGLCQKIMPPAGTSNVARYDADLEDHLHIVTPEGRLLDVPSEFGRMILSRIAPEDLRQLEAEMGIRISRVTLQLLADAETEPTAD